MAKKKLLLVVGAGASVEFDIPSVKKVGEIIESAIQEIYPLASVPASNLYKYIQDMIHQYWEKEVPAHLFREPHFEDVLYSIFALAAAYPAGVNTSALGALIEPRALPDVLEFGRSLKKTSRNELRHLAAFAVDAIADGFRKHCKAAEKSKVSEFGRLREFVAALRGEFDLAVVTLNYDNIMHRAYPGVETGFDPATGRFLEERVIARSTWPCMLHLHGSVHFDMPTPSGYGLHEIQWQPDINASFAQNALGRNSRATLEGTDFPTSVLVAGYGKTMQILPRPFRTYYSELDRLVSGCDAALFTGYGFGDPHLNIAFDRFRDGRRRPIVIIGFAPKGTMTLSGADPDNPIARAATHTLHTDVGLMTWLGHRHPHGVDDLLDAREFEISSDPATPLSVWYNGMLEACNYADKFIGKLK
jgi:hypothetical protein